MEGSVSSRWTSSFTVTDLITYPPPRGHTILPSGRRTWSWFFFVEGTNWVCREEEWATMPHGYFDNRAYVKESSWKRQLPLYLFYSDVSNTAFPFFIAASARPSIIDEQLGFIQRILEIPLDQRKCWHLINLDTLHLYCGGPDPSPEAWKLGEYSRRRKWILYITSRTDVLFFLTSVGLFCRDGRCQAKD